MAKKNMELRPKKAIQNKLIEAINKAIEELKADGTYQKIYSKWFKD